MRKLRKSAAILLTMALIATSVSFAAFTQAFAAPTPGGRVVTFNMYDDLAGLAGGDAVPAAAPGQFGRVNGNDVKYMDDGTDRFVRVTLDSGNTHSDTYGFQFPAGLDAYPVITARYEVRFNGKSDCADQGFGQLNGAGGYAPYNDAGYALYRYNGDVLATLDGTYSTYHFIDAGSFAGPWQNVEVEWDRTTNRHTLYVNGVKWYSDIVPPTRAIDLFFFSYINWSADGSTDIKNLTMTFEKEITYSLNDALAGLSSGQTVPDIAPGQFGRVNGNDVKYINDGTDRFVRVTLDSGNTHSDTFGFQFPANMDKSMITAEYKVRFNGKSDCADQGFGQLNGAGGYAPYNDAGYALYRYNGDVLATLDGTYSTYHFIDAGSFAGPWQTVKVEWDQTTNRHTLYVNGVQWYSDIVPPTRAIDLFFFSYINWSADGSTDIKDLTVTFGKARPVEQKEDQDADAANPYTPTATSTEWTGIPDQTGAFDYTLPGGPYTSGRLYAFFRLKADSMVNYRTAGFANGANAVSAGVRLGSGGSAFALTGKSAPGDSEALSAVGVDRWYSYYLIVDFSVGKMFLWEWDPAKPDEPMKYSFNLQGLSSLDRFRVTSDTPVNVRDVMLAHDIRNRNQALISPADGLYYTNDLRPAFSWKTTEAVSYVFQLSKTADFAVLADSYQAPASGAASLSYRPAVALENDSTYYWRVLYVYNQDGTDTSPSDVYSLTTEPSAPPQPIVFDLAADSHGLIEGEWIDRAHYTARNEDDIAAVKNAQILQGLLDYAGRNGGGKIILPEGSFRLRSNVASSGQPVLRIQWDNLTLTGRGGPEWSIGTGPHGTNENIATAGKTRLLPSSAWDPYNGVFRNSGIRIIGTQFSSKEPRKNIELSYFELEGGRGFTSAAGDWGYNPNVDYSWDIGHQGIVAVQDLQATHLLLDHLWIHRFSGEQLYQGGLNYGYLEMRWNVSEDTNASCFNLFGQNMWIYNNQFGGPNTQSRFWVEYCNRSSHTGYNMPPLPVNRPGRPEQWPVELNTPDTSVWENNTFYNAVAGDGIALAQGDATRSGHYFRNNYFNNAGGGSTTVSFLIEGGVYGPICIQNNIFENMPADIFSFGYGGNTVNEQGQNVTFNWNKNFCIEDNVLTNIGGALFKYQRGGDALTENVLISGNSFTGTGNSDSIVVSGTGRLINMTVTGNIFTDTAAPSIGTGFVGNVPLFEGNTYSAAPLVSSLTAANPVIAPTYEYREIRANADIPAAVMSTGRYEDGQTVTLFMTGPNSVTFPAGQATYDSLAAYTLKDGDSLVLQYDAAAGKWAVTGGHQTVDKTKLAEALSEGAGKDRSLYTAASLAALDAAIADGTAVYDNPDASQAEVDAAAAAIAAAMESLAPANLSCPVKSMLAKIAKPQLIPVVWDGEPGLLTFTSSNPAVCGVTQQGALTPMKAGVAVITISAPNQTKIVFAVTVTA
ncbi:MAG: right-handed parallel beta-helix repeat-containing protein [Firmicutes bacterium]|nr:right-handed parallel beta-helix repeat-containing protein [Bacillota bacterium]